MKKIEYNNKERLKDDFLEVFKDRIPVIQNSWNVIRNKVPKLQMLPYDVREILIMEFDFLAKFFAYYRHLLISKEDEMELTRIFQYKGENRSRILRFFISHSQEMGIYTCCYCDLSYINVYYTKDKKYTHFDLDHFFPKRKCPIFALSLFNLIPCCSVCNQRLKRDEAWGDNPMEAKMTSPSSPHYAFDENVKFRVIPKDSFYGISYQDNPDKFRVKFISNTQVYSMMIDKLHLNERYEFHKCEALRLMDLIRNYPETNIRMISSILRRSELSVKEEIFHQDFILNNNRTFSKLYKDLLSCLL